MEVLTKEVKWAMLLSPLLLGTGFFTPTTRKRMGQTPERNVELMPKYNARDIRRVSKIVFEIKLGTMMLVDKEGAAIRTRTDDNKTVFDGGPLARMLFVEALRVHNTHWKYLQVHQDGELEVWEVQ